jgi:hypothetical protein
MNMHKPTGKAEPRFDLDYSYGREGEIQIAEFLGWIASDQGQVEVKRKRILDLFFYVETHCDKGRRGIYQPSGILVTTAKTWAFVIGDTRISVLFPIEELRAMLDDPSSRDKQEEHGSCPTRGKLISLSVALYRHKKRLESGEAPPQSTPPSVSPAEIVKLPGRFMDADEINW